VALIGRTICYRTFAAQVTFLTKRCGWTRTRFVYSECLVQFLMRWRASSKWKWGIMAKLYGAPTQPNQSPTQKSLKTPSDPTFFSIPQASPISTSSSPANAILLYSTSLFPSQRQITLLNSQHHILSFAITLSCSPFDCPTIITFPQIDRTNDVTQTEQPQTQEWEPAVR
jgi:hypothetical protein